MPIPCLFDHFVLPLEARLFSSLVTYRWFVIFQISSRKYHQVVTWLLCWARGQVGLSCKPPFLQESVLDTPGLVGWAKQQLGELADKSLSDLVHVTGYLFVCVCWRKMISSSIGPCDQLLDLSSYQSFDLSVGYRQIKLVPTIFVMLSYSWLIPRAYIIISFGSDQCYHLFT